MTACRTRNGLFAGFQDKNSQPGAFLSAESFVPSPPLCVAKSNHFRTCCCYSVPDLTFLALVIDAAKASLKVEKDPGTTSSNVSSALLGHSAIMLNTQGWCKNLE